VVLHLQRLALETAEQALTLLRNEGGVLPLPAAASLAVIGPLANATTEMLSIYAGENRRVLTDSPLAALRRRYSAVVGYAPGCSAGSLGRVDPPGVHSCTAGGNSTSEGIAKAAALARTAHTAVVVVGLVPAQQEGEGLDRHDLRLPGAQAELVRAVLAANRRTVVVMINGGPLDTTAIAGVPGLLEAFYPGQAGGTAIARVLCGDVSPSGRLPTTHYTNALTARRAIDQMNLRAQVVILFNL
jgi:beta-glucosidase